MAPYYLVRSWPLRRDALCGKGPASERSGNGDLRFVKSLVTTYLDCGLGTRGLGNEFVLVAQYMVLTWTWFAISPILREQLALMMRSDKYFFVRFAS